MNFEQIKQEISISAYLESIGCKPQFENKYSARYISPYRTDTNPSLSVNLSTNLFFDHGTGKGGNVIQLVALINNFNDFEAAKILTDQKVSFSFHCNGTPKLGEGIKIQKVQSLQNRALLQYLHTRKINTDIGRRYCNEAYYTIKDKPYFALAFENLKGGYELRSKYFKGCTNKAISYIRNNHKSLDVFEGFIDFLSFMTYHNMTKLNSDIIILNSLSTISHCKLLFPKYDNVNLYLDNDTAGIMATTELINEFPNIQSKSLLYSSSKDFNDFIINTSF